MAGGKKAKQAQRELGTRPLGASALLALTDDMLSRGVARFEFAGCVVEFAPSTIAAEHARKVQEAEAAATRAQREEAGAIKLRAKAAEEKTRMDLDRRRLASS